MRVLAIRPKSNYKRKRIKVAVYTVAFDIKQMRTHDSSFKDFCKKDCEFAFNCKEQCNKNGEYGRVIYIWNQNGYLYRYFKNQFKNLNCKRYDYINAAEAIKLHKQFLLSVEQFIISGNFEKSFVPLYKNPSSSVIHPEFKYKLHLFDNYYENWIRIYALRFKEDNGIINYIITGGAIKLVRKMSDYPVIEYEERKQEQVIKFLIENGYTTREKIELLQFEYNEQEIK